MSSWWNDRTALKTTDIARLAPQRITLCTTNEFIRRIPFKLHTSGPISLECYRLYTYASRTTLFYLLVATPFSAFQRNFCLVSCFKMPSTDPKYWSPRLYRFELFRNILKLWVAKAWAILILGRTHEMDYVSDCTDCGRTCAPSKTANFLLPWTACHPASPRVQTLDLLPDLGIKSEKRPRSIVIGTIGSFRRRCSEQ